MAVLDDMWRDGDELPSQTIPSQFWYRALLSGLVAVRSAVAGRCVHLAAHGPRTLLGQSACGVAFEPGLIGAVHLLCARNRTFN